jgi:hypothetical protein
MKLEGDLRYAVEVWGVRRKWQRELIAGKMPLETDWRLPEMVEMQAGSPERDLLVLRRRHGSLLRTDLREAMTRIFDTDLAPAPGSSEPDLTVAARAALLRRLLAAGPGGPENEGDYLHWLVPDQKKTTAVVGLVLETDREALVGYLQSTCGCRGRG